MGLLGLACICSTLGWYLVVRPGWILLLRSTRTNINSCRGWASPAAIINRCDKPGKHTVLTTPCKDGSGASNRISQHLGYISRLRMDWILCLVSNLLSIFHMTNVSNACLYLISSTSGTALMLPFQHPTVVHQMTYGDKQAQNSWQMSAIRGSTMHLSMG